MSKRFPKKNSGMLRGVIFAVLGCLFGLSAHAQESAAGQVRSAAPGIDMQLVEQTVTRAENLERLHALIVAYDGRPIVERVFRGPNLDRPVNIKSASKTIISALVGIAIEKGVIAGTQAPIRPLLESRVPSDLDPRVDAITVDHLLTMRAGLERTSGPFYGPWVVSPNWVRYAMSRPFVDAPGGGAGNIPPETRICFRRF